MAEKWGEAIIRAYRSGALLKEHREERENRERARRESQESLDEYRRAQVAHQRRVESMAEIESNRRQADRVNAQTERMENEIERIKATQAKKVFVGEGITRGVQAELRDFRIQVLQAKIAARRADLDSAYKRALTGAIKGRNPQAEARKQVMKEIDDINKEAKFLDEEMKRYKKLENAGVFGNEGYKLTEEGRKNLTPEERETVRVVEAHIRRVREAKQKLSNFPGAVTPAIQSAPNTNISQPAPTAPPTIPTTLNQIFDLKF